MRDRHNISSKENWAESIVHKQWDMIYWNSIFRVDNIQLEVIQRIASTVHLLPKDLHISWYLCKSSKDIYHNAKHIQEEAESFMSSEISKPIVTPAFLKCAARDIIQAIDPHEELLSSSEHISYCVQVIAMENYLDHPAPVYQEQPPQDSSTGAHARHIGTPQTCLPMCNYLAQMYQSLVRAMKWAISIEHFDISMAVMTLSSFWAQPHCGHLECVKCIYHYLYKVRRC